MDMNRILGLLKECEKNGENVNFYEGVGQQSRDWICFRAIYVTRSGKWLLRPMFFVTHYMGTYLDPMLYKDIDHRKFWLNVMTRLVQAHKSGRLLIDSASQTSLNGNVLETMLELSVDAAERVEFFQDCHTRLKSLFEENVIESTFDGLVTKYQGENALGTVIHAYNESRKELDDFLKKRREPESLSTLWQLRTQLVSQLSHILPRGTFDESPKEILNGYRGSIPRYKEMVDLLLNG